MNAKFLIQELLDSVYSYEWRNDLFAQFKIDSGRVYHVTFVRIDEHAYQVLFDYEKNDRHDDRLRMPSPRTTEKKPRTGEKDAFKVISTVVKIMDDFLKKFPTVTELSIQGDDYYLHRTYKTMAMRYARKFGYKVDFDEYNIYLRAI